MPLRESQIEAHFRKLVRTMGGVTEKLAPISAGMPDRLVIFQPGRIYLVELKADHGALRDIQKVWHERAAARGVHVVVLKGLEEARDWVIKTAAQEDGEEQ